MQGYPGFYQTLSVILKKRLKNLPRWKDLERCKVSVVRVDDFWVRRNRLLCQVAWWGAPQCLRKQRGAWCWRAIQEDTQLLASTPVFTPMCIQSNNYTHTHTQTHTHRHTHTHAHTHTRTHTHTHTRTPSEVPLVDYGFSFMKANLYFPENHFNLFMLKHF